MKHFRTLTAAFLCAAILATASACSPATEDTDILDGVSYDVSDYEVSGEAKLTVAFPSFRRGKSHKGSVSALYSRQSGQG